MKVAELYAQLGVKVDRHDLGMLKEFEHTLNGIASAAKNAALALKQLAQTPLSRGFSRLARTAATGATAGTGSTTAPSATSATPATAQQTATEWWKQFQAQQRQVAQLTGPAKQTPAQWWKQFQAQQRQITQLTGPLTGSQPQQTSFAQTLVRTFGAALLKVLGVASLVMALKQLTSSIKDSMRMAMQTSKTQRQTGMALASLRRYEYIGGLAGMEPGAVQETFQNFRQMFENLRETGTLSAVFAKLGMTISSDAEAMFRSFFQATKDMDEGRAKYFASLLGISDDLLFAMRNFGDAEVPKSLLPTQDQLNSLSNLNVEWNRFVKNLSLLGEQIAIRLNPALESVLNTLNMIITNPINDRPRSFSESLINALGAFGGPGTAFATQQRLGSIPMAAAPVVNYNIQQNLQSTGYSRADGQNLARAFSSATDISRAYFQRSGSFLAPTAVP